MAVAASYGVSQARYVANRGVLSTVLPALQLAAAHYANGATHTQWDALTTFRGVTEGDITRYAIPKKEPLLAEHEDFRDTVLDRHPPVGEPGLTASSCPR